MRVPSLRFLYVATAVVAFLIVAIRGYSLVRTGQPSADVIAAQEAPTPFIEVSDFAPGDATFVILNGLPIVVWRRSGADKALAASQNDPAQWHNQYSSVYGRLEPVLADDANLTLENEWFVAIAQMRNGNPFIPLMRFGDYGGFWDSKFASHFDLSGRYRAGKEVDNLTVVPAEFTADRQRIRLDMSGSKWPPLSY